MNILCTFPGKYGDLLWALPSIRALVRQLGEAVDLCVAHDHRSITPLIAQQPYIGRCFALLNWQTENTAPISPRIPPISVNPPVWLPEWESVSKGVGHTYDHVLHLGYRWWPKQPLPFETLDCLNTLLLLENLALPLHPPDLQLSTPWVTIGGRPHFEPFEPRKLARIAVGFTDEHFELKYGLMKLVDEHSYQWAVTAIGESPRWHQEAGVAMNWAETLAAIQACDVFLGCNSALHVLALAAGKPVVMMEPNPHRHHGIFYPLGWSSTDPSFHLVIGNDGMPTFDARAVCTALEWALGAAAQAGETGR